MNDKESPALHERAQQNARDPKLMLDPVELVDHWWDKLANERTLHEPFRTIDREQLCQVMEHAAMAALDGLEEPTATGPIGPHNDVTRFITHPDFRVTHPNVAGDMTVQATFMDGGVFTCECLGSTGAVLLFPFDQLWPAGAASDAMRTMVSTLMLAVTEDMVAQLLEAGALIKPDPSQLPAVASPEFARPTPPATVIEPDAPVVVNLSVHPEYIMDPKGVETIPTPSDADLPETPGLPDTSADA